VLSLDELAVTPETTLAGDLKMDDLDVVQFVMILETRIGLEIPEDPDQFKTVRDVVTYIRKTLG
jgi:acyl carrier protein